MDSSILSIGQNNLLSEATRQIIGTRNIDLYQTYKTNSRGQSRKKRLGGFLNMLGQGALDYLFSNLTEIVMGSILTLYLFDWNQTDEEIQAQMKANELAMISSAGRLAADGLIRFPVMGATKQAKHRYPRIDPTAIAMLQEENSEELVQSLRSFLMATRANVMSNMALSTFMTGRQMMMGAQTKKTESFIIADKVEKIAESQKNPQIKAFLQGFVEQAEDVIFDLAYLVCNTISSTYEMNKLAARQSEGPTRLVQFTPDKEVPEVKTLIYGTQAEVMTTITAATTQQAVMAEKDLGQIIQVGLDQALKAERNERLVTAYFYSGVNGATRLPDGKRSTRKVIRIPNVKTSVDWDLLKSTLTPIDGGSYKVIAHLDDGHTLQGFFATESEGRSYLTSLSNLCKGDIVKWTTIEPNSDPKFRLETARFSISTASFRITRKTSSLAQKDSIDSNGQMWRIKTLKLNLRSSTKPADIDILISDPWRGSTV
jgi:hypothetical protein